VLDFEGDSDDELGNAFKQLLMGNNDDVISDSYSESENLFTLFDQTFTLQNTAEVLTTELCNRSFLY
jgi:hypothetical protein